MPVDYRMNALNFEPINQGLNSLGQGYYRNQQLGMEQQRQQSELKTQGLQQQQLQQNMIAQHAERLAGQAQDIAAEQDPAIRAQKMSALASTFDAQDHAQLQQLGIDLNSPNAPQQIVALARGYQNPQDVALKGLQIKQGEQNLEMGKFIPVPPGTDLLNVKTGQFVQNQGGGNIVGTIADGIQGGRQPPVFTGMGMGKLVGPIRAELERRGINVAEMQNEWNRAQAQIRSLNGPQMTRYVGLAQSVDKTIDRANQLAEQMQQSGIPLLNKAELIKLTQTQGNTPAGQLATQYLTAVNTLKEEFAGLAQGGYAPTEPAWELANQQINANYGVKQLGASLGEIQRLMRYRLNGIPGINAVGPGAANRYIPGEEQPMGAQHDATAPAPNQAQAAQGWSNFKQVK